MYGSSFDGMIIIFAVICAVAGWGVIEFLLWLLGHISVSFS